MRLWQIAQAAEVSPAVVVDFLHHIGVACKPSPLAKVEPMLGRTAIHRLSAGKRRAA